MTVIELVISDPESFYRLYQLTLNVGKIYNCPRMDLPFLILTEVADDLCDKIDTHEDNHCFELFADSASSSADISCRIIRPAVQANK